MNQPAPKLKRYRPMGRLAQRRRRATSEQVFEFAMARRPKQVQLPERKREWRQLKLKSKVLRTPDGKHLINFAEEVGQSGVKWSGGLLEFEDHPELSIKPGLGEPSVYWDLARDPLIAGMRRKLIGILAGTPYRVDKPELPFWQAHDPVAKYCLDVQHAFCARMFHEWGLEPRGGFKRFVRESVRTVPIDGHALFELVANWRRISLGPGLGSHLVLLPRLPKWRAPWSVSHWLTNREEFAGVCFGYGYTSDFEGEAGAYETVIRADKLLHISTGQVGSNLEGVSWLRELYNTLHAKRDGWSLEQLSYELAAIRELFFSTTANTPVDGGKNIKNMEEYILHRKASQGPGAVLPDGVTPHWGPTDMVDFDPMMKRHNQSATVAWGQVDQLIATDGTGSYAARSVASSDSRDVFDDPIGEMVVEPTQEVFARFIRHSFPKMVAAGYFFPPTLGYGQVEETDNQAYVATVGDAKDREMLGEWTHERSVEVSRLLDIPPPPKPKQANTSNPSVSGSSPEMSQAALTQGRPGWKPQGDGSKHVGIFARLPGSLAASIPDTGGTDTSPSHVTVLYVGELKPDQIAMFYGCVVKHLSSVEAPTMQLGSLERFEKPDEDVWFASVVVSQAFRAARTALVADLRSKGIEPQGHGVDNWTPHVTLKYAAKGEQHTGPVPSGEWTVTSVEIWGTPEHIVVPLQSKGS